MPKLIKNGELVQEIGQSSEKQLGPSLTAVPGKNFIVPLKFWKMYQDKLEDYFWGYRHLVR
ncbi:MAG: hypothetical protein CM1200mP40_29490 [Gammaproteobacteria bacterium]|nr:MAG: hypothetical protein CM1200mP40_29490 [Gammaproteobacteria bacterium]